MEKVYKLACNFNVVEFKIKDGEFTEQELIDLLQREYDVLASINVIAPISASQKVQQRNKQSKKTGELATEAQLYALDEMGIDYDVENITKKEAWLLLNKAKEGEGKKNYKRTQKKAIDNSDYYPSLPF